MGAGSVIGAVPGAGSVTGWESKVGGGNGGGGGGYPAASAPGWYPVHCCDAWSEGGGGGGNGGGGGGTCSSCDYYQQYVYSNTSSECRSVRQDEAAQALCMQVSWNTHTLSQQIGGSD